METVTIPKSVIAIWGSSFEGCNSLSSIVVDKDNQYYDSRENCNAIIETTTNTLIIGGNKTIIPNSVTSIGGDAFIGRKGLTSINIPCNVTLLYSRSFEGCYDLNSIVVDSENKIYDSREECNAIIETSTNKVIVGSNNTIFPSSVNSIEWDAFNGRKITSVTIVKNIETIGSQAFYNCKLENVITLSTKTLFETAFSNATYQHAMLYIPTNTWWEIVYESSWYQFNNIRETVSSPDELSTSRAYTMMDANTFEYTIYDDINHELATKNSHYMLDEGNPNNCWQIVKKDNCLYLYNIGAHKYASVSESGKLSITDTPIPVDMRQGAKGIVFDEHSEKQWNFVLNQKMEVDKNVTCIDEMVVKSEDTNGLYGLDGCKINRHKKGVNFIRTRDGRMRKVMVK